MVVLLLLVLPALSGCYVLNQKHYEDVSNIRSNIDRLKAADERLAARIAELRPVEHAFRKEFAAEIRQQKATIRHPSANSVGMSLVDPLLFASGSAEISGAGRVVLERLARTLQSAPAGALIRVAGHTDAVPLGKVLKARYIDNWGLSSARAAAVARALIWGKQIDERRFRVEGRAWHDPVAGNDSPEGRAKNRRVEVFVELPE